MSAAELQRGARHCLFHLRLFYETTVGETVPLVILRFRFNGVWVEVEQGSTTCDNIDRRFVALPNHHKIGIPISHMFL